MLGRQPSQTLRKCPPMDSKACERKIRWSSGMGSFVCTLYCIVCRPNKTRFSGAQTPRFSDTTEHHIEAGLPPSVEAEDINAERENLASLASSFNAVLESPSAEGLNRSFVVSRFCEKVCTP